MPAPEVVLTGAQPLCNRTQNHEGAPHPRAKLTVMPDEPLTPEIYDRSRYAPAATSAPGEPSSAVKRRINKLRDMIRIAARSVYELLSRVFSQVRTYTHQEGAFMTSTV